MEEHACPPRPLYWWLHCLLSLEPARMRTPPPKLNQSTFSALEYFAMTISYMFT